jgi:hypothetical protein
MLWRRLQLLHSWLPVAQADEVCNQDVAADAVAHRAAQLGAKPRYQAPPLLHMDAANVL